MELDKRTRQMIKMRETHTLHEIGKKFNISSERVRQILDPEIKNQKWCVKHKRYYSEFCVDCKMFDEYFRKIKQMTSKQLKDEVEKITPYNRSKSEVTKREALVKYHRDYFGMSFPELGLLFKRDHSTIIYLYYK